MSVLPLLPAGLSLLDGYMDQSKLNGKTMAELNRLNQLELEAYPTPHAVWLMDPPELSTLREWLSPDINK